MKIRPLLLILFFNTLLLTESHEQEVVVRNIGMKTNTGWVPSLSIFKQDFPADAGRAIRFKTLPAAKVYSKSATIYDATVISLFKDSTYIACFTGCLAREMTAGNYTCKGDTLILTGSKKVYQSLLKNEEVKALNYDIMEWGTLRYLLRKEGLVSLD